MAPWLADTIRQCDGLVDILAYWAFSDVFEEQGVVKQPFYGGYGLIAEDGLPKPAFNAFKLLHRLGDQRIEVSSNSALLTRRPDGTFVLAVWNLFLPEQAGAPKNVTLAFKGLADIPTPNGNAAPAGASSTPHRASISRVDSTHGSLLPAYQAMGSPPFPTRSQIEKLRRAAELPPPETQPLQNGQLKLVLPAQSLAVIEIR